MRGLIHLETGQLSQAVVRRSRRGERTENTKILPSTSERSEDAEGSAYYFLILR